MRGDLRWCQKEERGLQHPFVTLLMRRPRNLTLVYVRLMVKLVSLYVILLKVAEPMKDIKAGLRLNFPNCP